MNEQQAENIRAQIRIAESKVSAARRDIEQAKRAGLIDLVRDHELEVSQLEQFIGKLKAVYGA